MTALTEPMTPSSTRLSSHERLLIDIWLITLLVDRLAFPFDAARPLGIASLFLTVLALLGRSPRVAAGAFACDAVKLLLLMPDMANHLTVLLLIDVLLVWRLLRPGRTSVVAVMQPIQVMAILLYAVAAVHKMNSSFLDAASSCAVYIADSTLSWFWLPTLGGNLGTLVAWFAVGIEAALAVFLVIRRTRSVAVRVGLVFHGMLAFAPIIGVASFSVFMTATYVAFLDGETAAKLARWRRIIPERVLDAPLRRHLMLAAVITTGMTGLNRVAPDGSFLLARVAGVVVCASVLALIGFGRGASANTPTAKDGTVRPYTLVVAAFILLAAAAPYTGARTQLAFSMFSNLRTETAANHLFLPQLDVFDIQGDLVTIVEAPSPRFNDITGPDLVVPSYEVGRRLGWVESVDTLTVLEDGVQTTYSGAELRERFPEPGLVSGSLFRVRATEATGLVSCRH